MSIASRNGADFRDNRDSFATYHCSRPERPRGMVRCEWRYLAFFNYAVDPKLVRQFLPPHTELDLWRGHAWISLVGKTFKNGKLFGMPVPRQQDYEQVDLRLYVRRTGLASQPGVVFLQEVIPRPLFALAARFLFNEKFCTRQTARQIRPVGQRIRVCYAWRGKEEWNSLTGISTGPFADIASDSFEAFLAQRLWSYTSRIGGQATSILHVRHPLWRVAPLREAQVRIGEWDRFSPFRGLLQHDPDHAFLAEGSTVSVRSVRHLASYTRH